jgi:biopolymer transport protein ExbB/TolQ
LLGLLGTVTGMISTFDIITEFGTGDPKLLSSGISIALITTEVGLEVAIPTLIFGNLLSGWAESIKDDMEKAALRDEPVQGHDRQVPRGGLRSRACWSHWSSKLRNTSRPAGGDAATGGRDPRVVFAIGHRFATLKRGTERDVRSLVRRFENGKLPTHDGVLVRALQKGMRLRESGRKDLRPYLDDAFSVEEREVRKFSRLIVTLVTAAPLLGLLGTVIGMIETFESLGDMSLFSQSGGIAGIAQAQSNPNGTGCCDSGHDRQRPPHAQTEDIDGISSARCPVRLGGNQEG